MAADSCSHFLAPKSCLTPHLSACDIKEEVENWHRCRWCYCFFITLTFWTEIYPHLINPAAEILIPGWRRSRFERVNVCVRRSLGVCVWSGAEAKKLSRNFVGLGGNKKEDQIVFVPNAFVPNTPLNDLFAKGGRKDIELAAWTNSSNLWNNEKGIIASRSPLTYI